MIKRTLRLLGLPLLLLCWIPLVLYPLIWVLAIPIGYIYSGNEWYFFKQTLANPNSYEPPREYKLNESIPPGWTICTTGPWLSINPLLNLWHWYWIDKPTTPRPTTF